MGKTACKFSHIKTGRAFGFATLALSAATLLQYVDRAVMADVAVEPTQLRDDAYVAAFTVTNTNDSGPGSLRQAINDANNSPGLDLTSFNIPGGGVKTISPTTQLPVVSEAATIDGYTQPGASPNSLAVGNNAVLLIELSGNSLPPNVGGIALVGGGITLRGLVINRFDNSGFSGGWELDWPAAETGMSLRATLSVPILRVLRIGETEILGSSCSTVPPLTGSADQRPPPVMSSLVTT